MAQFEASSLLLSPSFNKLKPSQRVQFQHTTYQATLSGFPFILPIYTFKPAYHTLHTLKSLLVHYIRPARPFSRLFTTP